MYLCTNGGSSQTQYLLHVSRYRISYTRWTPGKFPSLHQRIVTCPWMRQSFSLPQCSVQCPPPFAFNMLSPTPPAKHATRRHFWLGKMALRAFFKAFPSYFSSLIVVLHRAQKATYLFFSFLLKGQTT